MPLQTMRRLALGGALALAALAAHAQPGGTVKILVGFAAGGSSDGVARMLAEKLQGELGRTVVVENKAGATGRIAVEAVLAAPPGNETYLLSPFSSVVFPPLTTAALRYDVFKDLRPVASITSYPLALAVSSTVPATNAREYVAWLRADPTRAQFGTAGLGGHNHFLGLQLGKAIGVEMNVVAYKGNSPMVTDLMAGHLPAGVMVAGDAAAHVQGGRIRMLGVLSPQRSPLMPDVPTFAEQGIDVRSGEAWYGLWAPASAQPADIARMQAAVQKVLALQEIRDGFVSKYFMAADFRDAEQTGRRLRAEFDTWQPVIKASGFKGD
jgi:tripartite-type tricarboxylate transporter receptor subunit TctC